MISASVALRKYLCLIQRIILLSVKFVKFKQNLILKQFNFCKNSQWSHLWNLWISRKSICRVANRAKGCQKCQNPNLNRCNSLNAAQSPPKQTPHCQSPCTSPPPRRRCSHRPQLFPKNTCSNVRANQCAKSTKKLAYISVKIVELLIFVRSVYWDRNIKVIGSQPSRKQWLISAQWSKNKSINVKESRNNWNNKVKLINMQGYNWKRISITNNNKLSNSLMYAFFYP